MKKIIAIFTLSLLGLSSVALADRPEILPEPPPVITGGYSVATLNDAQVQQNAVFATKAAAKSLKTPVRLVKVLSAQTQVVAGMNYQLCLQVKAKKRTRQIHAVVWNKLDGSKELTSAQFGCQ